MKPTIEQIVKHPAVTPHALANGQKADLSTGLGCIAQLRRARKDVKQAIRNAQDEFESGNPGYDRGGATGDCKMPGTRLLREAIAKGGLPDDLRQMIEEYLA